MCKNTFNYLNTPDVDTILFAESYAIQMSCICMPLYKPYSLSRRKDSWEILIFHSLSSSTMIKIPGSSLVSPLNSSQLHCIALTMHTAVLLPWECTIFSSFQLCLLTWKENAFKVYLMGLKLEQWLRVLCLVVIVTYLALCVCSAYFTCTPDVHLAQSCSVSLMTIWIRGLRAPPLNSWTTPSWVALSIGWRAGSLCRGSGLAGSMGWDQQNEV